MTHHLESNRKRGAVETALRSHDRIALIEDQRRRVGGGGCGGFYRPYHNAFNLLPNVNFDGDGCRCCYDPNGDGGEYNLLARAREDGTSGRRDDVGATWDEDEGEEKKRRDGTDDSDDGEFDYLLDEDDGPTNDAYDDDGPMARRRAELENVVRRLEAARCHRYGVHRQMSPSRVFAAAGHHRLGCCDDVRPPPRGSALHLFDPYSSLSSSLDLCMEDVARRYPGTKFVRGHGVASIAHAPAGGGGGGGEDDGWKRADLPMLLALRDGAIVAWSSGLRDFRNGNGTVWSLK